MVGLYGGLSTNDVLGPPVLSLLAFIYLKTPKVGGAAIFFISSIWIYMVFIWFFLYTWQIVASHLCFANTLIGLLRYLVGATG